MNTASRIGRWIALIIVLANIAYNYFYTQITALPRVEENSDRFDNLFTPAGYAFSIWGLIYLSFIVYAIAAILPSQREKRIYDRLAFPFILINILGSCWITAFNTNNIGLSVAIIAAMLIVGIMLFVRAQKESAGWLTVPFSLFAGWISVATIANAAAYLKSIDYDPPFTSEAGWATIMIAIAALIGIFVAKRFNAFVYSLVIVWAFVAIWVKQRGAEPMVSNFALGCAGALVIMSCLLAAEYFRKSKSHHKGDS